MTYIAFPKIKFRTQMFLKFHFSQAPKSSRALASQVIIVYLTVLTRLCIPHAASTILAAVFSLFWLTLATSTLVYRALPGTPWPNIPDRYFVNSPNFTLHISPSMESSISTIMNCTINTAMLSESVSRTYSIDLTVLSSFCRSQRTIYSRC